MVYEPAFRAPGGRPTVAEKDLPDPLTGTPDRVRTVVEPEMMLKSQVLYGSLIVDAMPTPMLAG